MSRRNKMGRSRRDGHIRLDRRRVSTGTDLAGSLTDAERLTIEGLSSPAATTLSPQARVLAAIKHPILLIYTVTADDPKQPDDLDALSMVEKDLTRTAVAIAFPKMSQEEIERAAKGAKKYQVNQVFWRAYNGFVDDQGDDIVELSDDE